MTTLINRADLLNCIKQYGTNHIEEFAAILGYAVPKHIEIPPGIEQVETPSIVSTDMLEPKADILAYKSTDSQDSYLHVVAHHRFKDDEMVTKAPEWYRNANPYQDNDAALKAPEGVSPPQQQPLMAWPRLWPYLKLALGSNVSSHKTDLSRLVDRLARGEQLRHFPKASCKGWASQAQLIIDYDESLLPFWNDFNVLRQKLAYIEGQVGLNVLAFPTGDPTGSCWQDTPTGWRTIERYTPPSAGSPVLILSDLGCNEASEQRRLRWQRFGEQLAHFACRAVALMPCPPRWWDAKLTRLFYSAYWDRAVRPPQRLARTTAYSATGKVERDNFATERLLSLLAIAVRVEPAILRAARYLFPAEEMDVGAEFAAWNHPAVKATHLAFYFQPLQVAAYRNRFRDHLGLSTKQKQKISNLLINYHASLSPVIAHGRKQIVLAELFGDPPPEEAVAFAQRLAKSVDEEQSEISRLAKQWLGRMGARQHVSIWNNEPLAVAWLKAHEGNEFTSQPRPEGLTLEKLVWALKAKSVVKCRIYQREQELVFTDDTASATGSHVGEISRTMGVVQIKISDSEAGQSESLLYNIAQPIPLVPEQQLTISTDIEELHLDWLTEHPVWADTIDRDEFGLYADLKLKGIIQRFRWIAPGDFLMGSPKTEVGHVNDELQHQVTLTKGFWLADSACTQALWLAVIGDNRSGFKNDLNNPVVTVSWSDTKVFIKDLNAMFPDLKARLPTEAEWEYACRAGTTTPFWFGDNITPEQVNYIEIGAVIEGHGHIALARGAARRQGDLIERRVGRKFDDIRGEIAKLLQYRGKIGIFAEFF